MVFTRNCERREDEMDIISVFTLLGGLALFLYGMTVMSSGLERLSGGRLESTLQRMTSSKFKGVTLGAGITIAIQSSSAMTVMLVGLVNSGILQLDQAISVIMGSNIGTTLTAWILSLAGIESDVLILRLLKPSSFAPLLAFIGIVLIMVSKRDRRKDIGRILMGFAILMTGMSMMSGSVEPLRESEGFISMLTMFNNPILGVLVGAVFTGIIQASAASVAILQALSTTGSITFGMALPIIMGQNIGTCVTALISSIGVNRNAKRVAVVHVAFNVIGTAVFLSLFYLLNAVIGFDFLNMPIDPFYIAVCHSIFNLSTTALLLPFTRLLERIAHLVVPDKPEKGEEVFTLLDDRLLRTPSFAVQRCTEVTRRMAETARETLYTAFNAIGSYTGEADETVNRLENMLDVFEDRIGSFLVKLCELDLTEEDGAGVSCLLHCIGNFERIGDHALNILNSAREMKEKDIEFSESARDELAVVLSAVRDVVDMSFDSFINNDVVAAADVEPLEQAIDGITGVMRDRHIARLQRGQCTIQLGFILSDILNNLERVSDHCSNIAVCLIRSREGGYDTHEYLHDVKDGSKNVFNAKYNEYVRKYRLP